MDGEVRNLVAAALAFCVLCRNTPVIIMHKCCMNAVAACSTSYWAADDDMSSTRWNLHASMFRCIRIAIRMRRRVVNYGMVSDSMGE